LLSTKTSLDIKVRILKYAYNTYKNIIVRTLHINKYILKYVLKY